MYNITLNENEWQPLEGNQFRHSTDGKLAPQRTFVELKYSDTHLHVRFRCEDNPFTNQNSMVRHNDDLYNQEVFELFISPSEADSATYLEVELNPNNALWIGQVHNPTLGGGGENELTMISYDESEIVHSVIKKENSWEGELVLPWKLFGNKTGTYRINFYRIILKTPQTNTDWVGNAETCDYTCWSPTMSGEEPAFHRPKRFGILHLE